MPKLCWVDLRAGEYGGENRSDRQTNGEDDRGHQRPRQPPRAPLDDPVVHYAQRQPSEGDGKRDDDLGRKGTLPDHCVPISTAFLDDSVFAEKSKHLQEILSNGISQTWRSQYAPLYM